MSFDGLCKLLNENRDIYFVLVDSLQRWDGVTEEQLDELTNNFPNVSFIFIAQSNNAGKEYRGFSKLAHSVDTVVNVKSGTARTLKHGDAESGQEMRVFTSQSSRPSYNVDRRVSQQTGLIFQGLNLK